MRLLHSHKGQGFRPTPALTRLLDLLRGGLHGGERIAEEGHDLRQLLRREVRRLGTLAGADTERDAIIVVHGDRSVQHVHGGEGLRRAVQTVGSVAVKGFDEGREIRDGDFLCAGALATGEGEADDGDARIVEADFDGVAGGGEGGRGGGVDEKLGHSIVRKVPAC